MQTAIPFGNASAADSIDASESPVVLRGPALVLARGYWLVIATLSVFFIARGIPEALHTIDAEMEGFPPPEVLRRGLTKLHLPATAFEVGPFVLSLIVTIAVLALAGILFLRRSNEFAPLVVALFFVSGRGATYPPEIADMWTTNAPLAAAAALVTVTWVTSFYWLFLIFPDGHIRPRWTVVPGMLFLGLGFYWFFISVNAEVAGKSDLLLLPAVLILAVYSQVYRWRRTPVGDTRQQMKWATLGLATGLAGFVLLNVLLGLNDWEHESNGALAVLATLVFFLGLELFVGIIVTVGFAAAIFRFRLYDVDIFISRTLVYSSLTAALAVTYFGVVVGLDRGLNAGLGVASPVALVAGVVAFEPLRRRLQAGTNRLMFGQRDEPYAVLATFGARLGDTLSPALVPDAIASTVTASLRLPWATVALEEDGQLVPVAASGLRIDAPTERFEIAHSGGAIGALEVQPRTGERALGDRDRRLIRDLCRQSGPALASLRLTEDLQRSRERLVTAREEERRRLRRDLHDGIGPRLAGLALRVETARDLAEDQPQLRGPLDDLADRLQDTVADIRRLVYGLRPPALDDLGLVGALRQVIDRDDPTGARIRLQVDEPLPALSAAVEAAVFRIVQEALTNIARHAPGATAVVSLRQDGPAPALLVTVSDDGPGAARDSAAGVGLHSMRERAEELGGTFDFATSATGSNVRVRLPLHDHAGAEGRFTS
ncbi:MAG: sensor histidine kinase [Dehalococcoidia bacterium]